MQDLVLEKGICASLAMFSTPTDFLSDTFAIHKSRCAILICHNPCSVPSLFVPCPTHTYHNSMPISDVPIQVVVAPPLSIASISAKVQGSLANFGSSSLLSKYSPVAASTGPRADPGVLPIPCPSPTFRGPCCCACCL